LLIFYLSKEDEVMMGANPGQASHRNKLGSLRNTKLENILRTLTMLEKALDRLGRQNYHDRKQYPPLILEIEECLNTLRCWIQEYKSYADLASFSIQLGIAIEKLGNLIAQLVKECKPSSGKRELKKSIKYRSKSLFANQLMAC
jgi:hypothetical protein